MGMDLLLCFFCHEISSLVKSSIMWDTMLVIRHYVSQRIMVWAEIGKIGKRSPYSNTCMSQSAQVAPSYDEAFQYK